MSCELTENRFSVVEDVMAKIGVFDLCSFFWTVAGTRKRGEDPYGLALQVLRYIKACAEKVGVEDVIFGADGPSGRSFRRSVCADYKAGREAKDPEHRAELDALTTALLDAGFTVHSAVASSGSSATGGEPEWFEGDDIVASFTVTILKDPDSEVVLGSNDWDLAPLLAFPKVRLFTTRGEERTAEHVKKDFGVEPLMLPQLKALAGDSDGYKPFPGLEKGKPGIGEKTAAAILEKFGSAEAAVRAALSDLPASAFDGLPSRTIAILRAGGVKALSMGLTCAKLRTDAPVPSDINVGEWEDVERALLDRQKAQQNEPRPEVAPPPADAGKAFQEAAHGQLSGRIREFAGEGAVLDLAGRLRDPEGLGVAEVASHPVCPRCLGVEPGKPAGDPKRPHPGPFTFDVCAACAVEEERDPPVVRPVAVTPLSIGRPIEAFRDNPLDDESAPDLDGPCPDGKCSHTRGEHAGVTGDDGCAVAGCPCMHEDNPTFRSAETPPAPRKRRSPRKAPALTPPVPDLDAASGESVDEVYPAEPVEMAIVILTEVEFIALAPLPALAAAGFLTPPQSFAEDFGCLLSALRNGLFEPRCGLLVGSVPQACERALSKLAETTQNEGTAVGEWAVFIDQLHVLPRFTDLAKYGGKLVRE